MTSSATQSQAQPLSFEEEAIKKNTDCVYFLASPLTCKKGTKCDYRHSDVARLNPRDCWYWLNSNCLNPKCAFRHPPLHGLLGTQPPKSAESSASAPRPATTGISHAPNSATVPCLFFKKGHCMKGDCCPFLHTPSSMGNKALPLPVTALATQPTTIKAVSSGIQKKVLDKNVSPAAVAKPISIAPKKATNDKAAPRSNGFPNNRNSFVAQQTHRLGEPESMNNKDVEEVSREPSPGFDVLVDNEGRDSDLYAGDDRYGTSGEHEAMNELEIGHSNDYNMIAGIDDERYRDFGYDPHEQRPGHRASNRHRASNENPDIRPRNDLRNRLTKHKKPNGLRSVINHESSHDLQIQDQQLTSFGDNSLSSRLYGRIGLSRRSPSPVDNLSRVSDRGGFSSHQGRIQGMIRPRFEEPFTDTRKDYRVFPVRRDAPLLENDADFPAPKSLVQLKNGKNGEASGSAWSDLQDGKRKRVTIDGQEHSGSDLSFEGPKSLEEILKRKRGETNGITSNMPLSSNEVKSLKSSDSEMEYITAKKEKEKPGASADTGMLNNNGYAVLDDDVEPETETYEQTKDEDYGTDDLELYRSQNRDAVGGECATDDVDDDDDDDFAKKMGLVCS